MNGMHWDDAYVLANRMLAVANPNRLQVLSIIAARPGIAAHQLRDLLQVAQPTMSGHVRFLKQTGLVIGHEPVEGFTIPLTVSAEGMQALADAIMGLSKITGKITKKTRKRK